MTARKKWVMGNWKMHGSHAMLQEMLGRLAQSDLPDVDVGIAPPFVFLPSALECVAGSEVLIGSQDVSVHESGAFTGEVAAGMLAEIGVNYVLVGHSERRAIHGETNEMVAAKAKAALEVGLKPVVCIGETLAEREAGETESVVSAQLKAVIDVCGIDALAVGVVAYEPVWAIGTGLAATPEQAQDVHAFLRKIISEYSENVALGMRIVYGGSVKPGNAQELFALPDVDGGLIGGASLKLDDFLAIVNAAG